MISKFPELLAPAGGEKQLRAAVAAGADAVYLAGPSFGARSSAQNFSREELADAVRYAHLYGVSVYVTVNTLILDEEMEDAVDFVDYLYEIGADAVILQDIGLTSIIRRRHPDLALHASTQMTFHNVEGVRYAKSMGFSRVVLPREMSAEEILAIAEAVDIELEVFIHGALCVSYSGMCLMSSYIGGRSGNRGSCAQPCRKKYELFSTDEAKTYSVSDARVLSPKDLSAAKFLDELVGGLARSGAVGKCVARDGATINGCAGNGVTGNRAAKLSLKIEGRLKDYDYVYNIVSAYRKLLDGAITADEADKMLENSYNRGYTKGFIFSEDSTEWHAGVHTGNRGTPVGTVLGVVPTAAWSDAHGLDGWRDNASKRKAGSSGALCAESANDGTRACCKNIDGNDGEFCDKQRDADFDGAAKYESGRAGRYVLILRLADALSVNDEVQCKFADGQTVGARAEWIVMGEQRVKSAPAGAVVGIPFGYRLSAGDALVRTYSVEHIAAVDAAMNVQPKRWSVALRAVMRAGEEAQIEAELRPLGSPGSLCSPGSPGSLDSLGSPGSLGSPAPLCSASLRAPTPQIATGRGTEPLRIIEQLTKFGGTPFQLDESLSRFDIASGIYVPISELNALRRRIVGIFTEHLSNRYKERANRLPSVLEEPEPTAVHEPSGAHAGGYIKLPAIIPSEKWEYYQQKVDVADGVELAHISQLAFCGLSGKRIRASYTMGIFNSSTLKYLYAHGVSEAEISTEIKRSWLTGNAYASFPDAAGTDSSKSRVFSSAPLITEISDTSGGNIALMRMKYCPVGAYFGGGRHCLLCKNFDFALRDEYGVQFPLRLDAENCMAEVLSPIGQKGSKLSK